MSITDANLVIEHSGAECDPDYVKSKFDQIFGPDFVLEVIEEVITADTKKFYLLVDQDHPALMRITDLIHENTFAAVIYKKEWDSTTRKYTEVHWKVFAHNPVFTPYLANEEQFAEMFLQLPPPIVRDTWTPGPCKLVRSTNEMPPEYDSPVPMVRSESDTVFATPCELFRILSIEMPPRIESIERSKSDTVFATPCELFRIDSIEMPPRIDSIERSESDVVTTPRDGMPN